jgi:hypothetical protein
MSPTEISAPLPAEVTPITRPTHRPSTITPAIAPGSEPNAIRVDNGVATLPARH